VKKPAFIDSVNPQSLIIEVSDAEIYIDNIGYLDEGRRFIETIESKGIKDALLDNRKLQELKKIEKLNALIKKRNMKWTAGETSISKLSYGQKKKLFQGQRLPNLQGFEYYKV